MNLQQRHLSRKIEDEPLGRRGKSGTNQADHRNAVSVHGRRTTVFRHDDSVSRNLPLTAERRQKQDQRGPFSIRDYQSEADLIEVRLFRPVHLAN